MSRSKNVDLEHIFVYIVLWRHEKEKNINYNSSYAHFNPLMHNIPKVSDTLLSSNINISIISKVAVYEVRLTPIGLLNY